MAEGIKTVHELITSDLQISKIYRTKHIPDNTLYAGLEDHVISEDDMKKISGLKNPPGILALVEIPVREVEFSALNGWYFLLDGISDPGNMGTLIRVADWFGLSGIFFTPGTVDPWNPKVVQATMGSIARVDLYPINISEFMQRNQLPLYGADLEGNDIRMAELPESGIMVIGSESHGISAMVGNELEERFTIMGGEEAESLNAAIAGGIIAYELFSRRENVRSGISG